MAASRILSRFLPGAENGIQDDGLQQRTPDSRLESGTLHHGDVDHFRDSFDEHELNTLLAEAEQSGVALEEPEPGRARHSRRNGQQPPGIGIRPKWTPNTPKGQHAEHEDVPESLLMEEGRTNGGGPARSQSRPSAMPSSSRTEEQWRAAQQQQRLHLGDSGPHPQHARVTPAVRASYNTPREEAMWRWYNVRNVDRFLQEVYEYYTQHGIWSILLSRTISLLTAAFLFSFFMFLSTCVDFSLIPKSKSTSEVLIPKCMQKASFVKNVLLWCFIVWWLYKAFELLTNIRRLWHLHEFYRHLLGIEDTDIQTVPWERVVEGLMDLRDVNPETADVQMAHKKIMNRASKQRMDAHDIANRLMRRDNYYIALFNKEVLDLTVPVPFLGNRQFYSKSLEWSLNSCLMNFIFDEHGQLQPSCLEAKDRQNQIETLQKRMRSMAIASIFTAPFSASAYLIYYFSRYYAEYRNSPAQLGARAFTPLAEWKFREFNELDHDFRRRERMAYAFADRYLNQFPKDKTNQTLQFVSLVTGTIAAVLGIATLLDPELFLGFEVTPGRTAFFYISICMGVFAAARGAVPDDTEVHEPVMHLLEVISYTHYCPSHWERQLHSNDVRVEFSGLYQMKVLIYLEEIMSLLIAPFILWRNANERAARIIDFFRDHTVHIDGLGHVCTEAHFNFSKPKRKLASGAGTGAAAGENVKDVEGLRADYFGTKDDKMAKSQYYFMQRLGQYDQQQASRYHHRPYHGIQMPPTFPPLSPLKEREPGHHKGATNTYSSDVRPVQMGSPQQSILLDVPFASPPLPPIRGLHPRDSRHPRARTERLPRDQRQPQQQQQDPDEIHEMTTSRLIEEDSSLADSWKTFTARDDPDEAGSGDVTGARKGRIGGEAEKRGNNGVLGLLAEYSKAHAGMGLTR